jgi:Zn-dependent protease/predicted transcriptional regulator
MARQDITVGKVFGIRIGVSFSWFIIFGLVTILLATAYFPQNYPNLPRYAYLTLGLITSFLFFLSVLLHELSHAVIARFNKIKISSITLFIFGGVAQMEEDAESPKAEFFMAIAGPFMSFFLAALFGAIYVACNLLKVNAAVISPFLYLCFINLYLGIFNLAPGFPLDGGRVLRSILWYLWGDVKKATRVVSWIGQAFAILLIGVGALMFIAGQNLWLNGAWLIFIGIFLWQVAAAGYEQVILHSALSGLSVRDIMAADVVSVEATTMLDALVDEYFMKYKHARFPVVEDGKTIGVVTLNDVKETPRNQWSVTRTRSITRPLAEAEVVSADLSAEMAIGRIATSGRGHLLVLENGIPAGILTMRDVMDAIRLKEGLGEKQ